MVGADRRSLGLLATVALAAAVAVAPLAGLASAGRFALVTATVAAVLWVTGAVPLALTALAIPVLLTAFGVYPSMAAPLSAFASPVVFLLLSGFVLAEALSAHDLDRRLAYLVMARLGSSPRRLVLAVMVTTALLSMVISNTATTAMMVPIALGLVRQVTGERPAGTGDRRVLGATGEGGGASAGDHDSEGDDPLAGDHDSEGGDPLADNHDGAGGVPLVGDLAEMSGGMAWSGGSRDGPEGGGPAKAREPTNMEVATLLGTAYAATVGGVGTIIGTPPNAIVVAQLRDGLGFELTFLDWLLVGLPLVVLALPLTWYVLVYVVYPPADGDVAEARRSARAAVARAGPLDAGARRTVAVFAATATLWLLGGTASLFRGVVPPRLYTTLFGGPGASVFGTVGHQGVLYFVLVGMAAIPALVLAGAADFDDLLDVDWATLLLLGGGISLANALADSGAVGWLADRLFAGLAGVPLFGVVLAVVAVTVLLGELASNTAMAAVMAPLLITVGPAYAAAIGTTDTLASVFLAIVVGVAASFGFALPVATPPNAIAYGTGLVGRRHMLRAGLLIDVVMILVVSAALYGSLLLVWPAILG